VVQRPVQFEIDNETATAPWVLMYPYLDWQPGCKSLPRLTYRVSTKFFTGEPREHTCTVDRILGSGAFGIVFRGELEGVGPIAVKIPRQRRTDADERLPDKAWEAAEEAALHETALQLLASPKDFLAKVAAHQDSLNNLRRNQLNREIIERFKLECGMLKRIAHPNVVRVYHVGEIGRSDSSGQWMPFVDCIVMEYLDATKAEVPIKGQRAEYLERDLPSIIKFGRDTALGVAAIHDHGSPHRDLSWLNVVIKQECGTAVVVDLGNVIHTPRLTFAEGMFQGRAFGLPGFIAPEQRDCNPCNASDQFSLGVQLYYWCTGQFPFSPTKDEPNGPSGRPLPLNQVCQGSDWEPESKAALDELSNVVMQSLERRAADRHPTMRDFAARLELILTDLGEIKRDWLNAKESTPQGSLLDDAKAIKIRDGVNQKIAAALVLQALARQCRFQISRFLGDQVDLIEEFLHFSDDVGPLPNLMTGIRVTAEKKVTLFISILKELINWLAPPTGTKPQDRFGRELQTKMLETQAVAERLLTAASRGSREPADERIARHPNQEKSVAKQRDWVKEYEEFFNLWRESHRELGKLDFEFAVYLYQVRKLANSLNAAPKGKQEK
jgi:serine/threonine protein kinase